MDACVEVLADERLRAEFSVKLKQFLSTLDVVLPRPKGLPFSPDAKVRKLIDDHVISMGVDPKIAPVSLTDTDFAMKMAREPNSRIFELLMRSRLLPTPQVEALVDKLMELARANHERLLA